MPMCCKENCENKVVKVALTQVRHDILLLPQGLQVRQRWIAQALEGKGHGGGVDGQTELSGRLPSQFLVLHGELKEVKVVSCHVGSEALNRGLKVPTGLVREVGERKACATST